MKKWLTLLGMTLGFVAASAAAQLPDFTELAEKQSHAVVNITTTQDAKQIRRGHKMPDPDEMMEFFRKFMPPEGERFMPPRRGNGSGFLISADGYILTNAHVVDDVDELVVKLNDKREFRAKVVGTDARTDVALIKINADNLPRVTIGDPNRLKVGEWVLAIGAPFGFENSVTAGIVSAKGRSLPQENYVPFIQTDAAVNPGNSGGPLFNLRGEVVGMNSQIISRSGGNMGLAFAIPIDVAMDVADQLKSRGKVSRGRLGIVIQEVTADLADSFGLKEPRGALVSDVEPGSPAEKAGVQVSDIILKFDGKTINTSIDLPRLVGATKPGVRSTLTIWRKGTQKELTVMVGELSDDKVAAAKAPEAKKANRAGLAVTELTKEQKGILKISSGVLVEETTGAAARAGIQTGDVIVAVNNQEVNSAEELARLLDDPSRKSAALLVKRGENAHYVSLRLDK
ncbi:MAG: DegQ family serine endoprotease [Thiobacillaceae bacterium]|jgi:serine protease Do|nr:DegQ family serine endoprotease [Hydrogenophilales bacterium]MBP9914840.1 DegQ family serine endoprotease [Thiobacillaceae bacterium]